MSTRTLYFVAPLAAVAGLALVGVRLHHGPTPRSAEAKTVERPRTVETLGPLPRELVESSGLAVSRHHPGILWTHNDSGDRPRFYALDMEARLLGTYDVLGATAVDWEDMALAPCPSSVSDPPPDGDCLYLADTGDNGRQRDTLTVYVVPEPDPADSVRTVTLPGRLRFRYPETRHDAEGVAVGPHGDLIVVTKGRTPDILLFDLPGADVARALRADSVVVLPAGRRLPVEPDWMGGRVVTGAAFSPDGATLAVRTYSEIWFFPWPLPDDLGGAATACFLGTLEPQGEAVDWEDATTLLLTSETAGGVQGQLTRVRCDLPPAP